jgi:septal ring factor EnvC (AmiA/AmiB activator)
MADKDYKLRLKKAGRNDTCPCGSGKKYKQCHLRADEERHSKDLAKAAKVTAAKDAEAAEKAEPEEKKEGPAHRPEDKRHKYAPKLPRSKPIAGSRQISTPRKAGTS